MSVRNFALYQNLKQNNVFEQCELGLEGHFALEFKFEMKVKTESQQLYIMCCLEDSTFWCGIWGMRRKEKEMRD